MNKETFATRLHDLIEHIEDNIKEDELMIKEEIIGKFMDLEDKEERELLVYSLRSVFRHLRRNCYWFWEKDAWFFEG